MKSNIRLFLHIIIIAVLSVQTVKGQYFTLGNDPGRAKWLSISSRHYRIIYPEETDSMARAYLYTLEKVRPAVMSELNINPKPIPVIIHPYTTMSNGVVTWAPKRMDLISSPDPYGSSPDSWMKQLAIHESRHVGQVEHFTRGIYSGLYYLLGEQVTGLGLGLLISQYVMEGDAVVAETELTYGGRGRNADFTRDMRTMYLNGDYRNWDRLLFGSNKYHTPDEYTFGYLLGSYIRYASGCTDLTGQYMSLPVKYWYNPAKLLSPVKYITGTSEHDYFLESQKVLAEMWRYDYLSRGEFSGYEYLKGKNDRLYTDFSNPIPVTDTLSPYFGSVLAVKEGMSTAMKLVRIDQEGQEHFMRFFNPVSSRPTYDGKNSIYWSETVSSSAAELEDFSVIMCFNILTGKTRTLHYRSKYFNPAPSVSGDTLAVAEYPVSGSSYLTFLSSATGEALFRVKAPENGQIRESVFIGDTVYSSVITENGIGIYRLVSPSEGWSVTVMPQSQSISGLKAFRHNLYFSSDLDGVVNIYRYNLQDSTLHRITNSEYGADYPYFDPEGRTLYYCEYGTDGYKPVRATTDMLQDSMADFSRPYRYPLAEVLAHQAKERIDSLAAKDTSAFMAPDTTEYSAKKFNKLLNAFHIHSWFPVYVDVDRIMTFSFERFSQVASLGATVLSQNLLGNVISTFAYGYVKDYYTGKYFHSGHVTLNAQIIGNLTAEARFDINERNSFTTSYNLMTGSPATTENMHTPLVSVSAMLYYPVRFNSRGWYRNLTPFISWSFNNDRYYAYYPDIIQKNIENPFGTPSMRHQLQYGVSYGQAIATAKSQIYPRWGFGITVRGIFSPGSGSYFRDHIYANGYSYFPGITRQQGIKLSFAFQRQMMHKRLMTTSSASLPRGYNRYSFADTYVNFTADYAIPVYLGDFRIGPVLYVKRLQLIPFADYAMDFDAGKKSADYFSYGSDILLDFNILRFSFPISAGVRYARTGPNEDSSRNYFGFLFSISF